MIYSKFNIDLLFLMRHIIYRTLHQYELLRLILLVNFTSNLYSFSHLICLQGHFYFLNVHGAKSDWAQNWFWEYLHFQIVYWILLPWLFQDRKIKIPNIFSFDFPLSFYIFLFSFSYCFYHLNILWQIISPYLFYLLYPFFVIFFYLYSTFSNFNFLFLSQFPSFLF
jgi:hypothetical protein